MRLSHICSLLALCGAVLLSSCASGPDFASNRNSPALRPTPTSGLVLMYWQGGMVGTANRFEVYGNGTKLTDKMRRGAFYSYQAKPGSLKLSTNQAMNWSALAGLNLLNQIPKDQLTLEVAPNQTYFLEVSYGAWREKIAQVSPDKALRDIEDCAWINPPGSEATGR